MNKYSLQQRGFRIVLSSMLLLLILVMTSENAVSQSSLYTRPQVPLLSLTGAEDGYNTDWYPDGRIWLPVSIRNGAPREFLMPVFIDNKWWHYKSTSYAKYLVPDPIYSFRFKIFYDGVALTPVDIITVHPFPEDDTRAQNVTGDFTPPLAKDFNIAWDVHKDLTYQNYLLDPGEPPNPLAVRQKGRVIVISGSSTKPLPVCDTARPDFNVLLYIKFRINIDEQPVGEQETSLETPMYISNDSILYNDWNVRSEIAFKELQGHDSVKIDELYTQPSNDNFVGISGMTNHNVSSLWSTYPILPGTIYLQLTKQIPNIWYDISRTGSQPPIWDNSNNPDVAPLGTWIIRDPLSVDSGKVHKPDHVYGSVKFTLKNSVSKTRLLDLWVESDAQWLTFDVQSINRSKYVQIGPTQAYIYYLDNSILGEGADNPDPVGNLTDPDAVVEITINCDPDKVTPHSGEKAGIYTGYITLRSSTAQVSPVRMRVTFINFRNPFEPDDGTVVGGGFKKQHRGINLTVRNSRGLTGDETKLVFGTGHRATDGVDTLYGEFGYAGAQTGFGARWYHPDESYAIEQGFPFGLGDMLPERIAPFSESRDIRDINDSTYSHVYLCRFNADGAQNYPVIVEWDTTDFPEGAQLFLSDTLNGSLFPSVNMRQSTHVSGNIMSYAIQDPKITSFKIEYTQPKVVDYVDADGNPKINKGWNLLSLPVRPKNLFWNVVYPNAINRPFSFFGNGWEDQENLKPGQGYFIKYSDKVDTKFKGTPMRRITKDQADDGFADEVRLFPGWNTIGGISFPMNTSYIDFDEKDGGKPSKSYVRKYGIWGYRTNVGYYETSILDPGIGYWMKIDPDKHGYLRLIHPTLTRVDDNDINYSRINTLNSSDQLVIRDNAQHETNLYLTEDVNVDVSDFELPPAPMSELFDARFAKNTILETGNSSMIKLQGIEYPISVFVNDANANYTFVDAITGDVLGSIEKGKTGNVEIKSTSYDAIKILKTDVVTGLSMTNNPNPVLSTSTIKYVIPVAGNVTLKIYDALGNSFVIDEGYKNAGENTAQFDASGLASGKYVCKLVSGSIAQTVLITVVK